MINWTMFMRRNKMVNVQSAIRKTFLSRGIVRLLGGE